MMEQVKYKIQNHFPMLSNTDLLQEISDVAQLREAQKGDILMDVGQYIKFMPLVISGVIKIIREDESEKEVLLYYLEGGKTCAMSMTCCMQQTVSTIRATVEEDVELLMIPVKYVDEWMMKYKDWKNFIMNTFSNRFDQLLNVIDAVTFKKMDERLLHYISEKLKSTQAPFLTSSKTDIALELGTSREVVSRMMKKLEQDGYVREEKGKVYLV